MTCARREAGALSPAPSTSADSPRRPEPRPGRFGARLFFFPALALLLGALSLFHAAPAEAQNTPPSSDSIIGVHDPTNLVVTAGDQRLELSWTHNFSSAPDGAGHWVQYKTTAATSWTTSTSSLAPTATSHSITSLVNGTAYNVRIFAVARTVGNTLVRGDFVTGSGTPASPPTVTLAVTPNPVAEGSSVTVRATLPTTAAADVTIPITVTLDSAETADLDATNLASVRTGLDFLMGTSTASQTLATEQDADAEDETFTVALGTLPTGYAAGSTTSVTVTIEDDEETVSLSASPNPVQEGTSVTVTATLSAAAAANVTIPVTVTAGTAETGDYGALTSIAINSGATAGTGTITTAKDADEDEETFTVALGTLPSGYVEGSVTSVQVTISEKPSVSLSASETVSEGYSVQVIAELSEPAASAVQVRLTLTLDTAELADFAAGSGVVFDSGATPVTGTRTLTIPAGEQNAEFYLDTEHDADGDDETFTVAIDTNNLPAGYGAGAVTSAQVTIDDDETLNTDPELLTGLTVHYRMQELYLEPNVAGDYEGLGKPGTIHTVQVSPGIHSVTVTPTWTNTAITRVSGSVRYMTYGKDGATLTWESDESDTPKPLPLVVPNLSAQGTTRLTLTLTGVDSEPYVILFQHNFDWESANDRLEDIQMRISQ